MTTYHNFIIAFSKLELFQLKSNFIKLGYYINKNQFLNTLLRNHIMDNK